MKVNQTLSTNDLLWEMLASEEHKNGFVLQAESQIKGKGQEGNKWITEPGKNLTMSIYIVPKIEAKDVFYLNMMASLAIRKTLEAFDIVASIKWPNDIFVGDKKIAGVLVKNQIQAGKINKTVLGIGLNINQTDFPIERPITSIKRELRRRKNIAEVFNLLYQNLDFYFDILVNQNFSLLKRQYLQHLYRKNAWNEYSSKQLGRFSGNILGVNDHGQLELQTMDGAEHVFDMQTIRFL